MTSVKTVLSAGAIAALCAGLGVPALADSPSGARDTSHGSHSARAPLTLAETKARVTKHLDHKIAKLTALRTRVAGDPDLTSAQKSAFTAKIDKALAALSTAKQRVAAATSKAAVTTALRGAGSQLRYPHRDHAAITLEQAKAWADAKLDRAQSALTKLRARVAADDRLSDAQQSAYVAKIDKALAAVASARTDAASATTAQGVREALSSAATRVGAYPRAKKAPRSRTVAVAAARSKTTDRTARLRSARSDDNDRRSRCDGRTRDSHRDGRNDRRDGGPRHHGGRGSFGGHGRS